MNLNGGDLKISRVVALKKPAVFLRNIDHITPDQLSDLLLG
jgi:hypothetical protein